jgi:hypothetical protein
MKPALAVLAALLVAPCACTRHPHATSLPTAEAEQIDLRPAVAPATAAHPAPSAAESQPPPTAEEIAAFHAPVPK